MRNGIEPNIQNIWGFDYFGRALKVKLLREVCKQRRWCNYRNNCWMEIRSFKLGRTRVLCTMSEQDCPTSLVITTPPPHPNKLIAAVHPGWYYQQMHIMFSLARSKWNVAEVFCCFCILSANFKGFFVEEFWCSAFRILWTLQRRDSLPQRGFEVCLCAEY